MKKRKIKIKASFDRNLEILGTAIKDVKQPQLIPAN